MKIDSKKEGVKKSKRILIFYTLLLFFRVFNRS